MKDTIKAKYGYKVVPVKNIITGELWVRIDDGNTPFCAAKLRTLEDYLEELYENKCFQWREIFTSVDGCQYLYWRDNELDADCITLVNDK